MRRNRVVAALLVLLMIAALLPSAAFADNENDYKLSALSGIYLSVNGQTFTQFGQTVKCGSGTATLTMDERNNPVLTLKNATINKAEYIGSDGRADYYAGIVFAGDEISIYTSGRCTLTAPAASSKSKSYEGIYTEGAMYIRSALTISGFDIGIEFPEDAFGYRHVNLTNCTITNCKTAIVCPETSLHNSNITACGSYAVIAKDSFSCDGKCSVTLNADKTVGDKCALLTGRVFIYSADKLSVTANVDTTSFPEEWEYEVYALCCNGFYSDYFSYGEEPGVVNATLNLTDNGKAYAVAFKVSDGDSAANAQVNIKGKAARAYAMQFEDFHATEFSRLSAVITGASDTDVPLFFERYLVIDRDIYFYASTDAENPVFGAMTLSKMPSTSDYCDGVFICKGAKILIPEEGQYSKSGAADKPVVITDADGKPARSVVLTTHTQPFIDVKDSDYFAAPVAWAYGNNITTGISTSVFDPKSACTRAQVVTFLWRAMGCPEVSEDVENPFTDVADGKWYTDAVLWAVENGITNGTSDTTFSPDGKVTRAQTVAFLYRAANGAVANARSPFTDVADGKWYSDAVLWAVENGITNGTDKTHFSPNAICTRGQIVTFLYRFIEN